jgi:hypothetical protein
MGFRRNDEDSIVCENGRTDELAQSLKKIGVLLVKLNTVTFGTRRVPGRRWRWRAAGE